MLMRFDPFRELDALTHDAVRRLAGVASNRTAGIS